jgi:hypothetical protein
MPKGKPKLSFKLTPQRQKRGWTRDLIAAHPNATQQELDALAALRTPPPPDRSPPREVADAVVASIIVELLTSGQLRVTQLPTSHPR